MHLNFFNCSYSDIKIAAILIFQNVGFTVEFTALRCTDNNQNQVASGYRLGLENSLLNGAVVKQDIT